MQRVAVLGSTGSLGRQAVALLRQHPSRFRIVGLGAGRQVERLADQVRELSPARVALGRPEDVDRLREALGEAPEPEILTGPSGLKDLVEDEAVDTICCLIQGLAAWPAVHAALSAGKNVVLGTKEILVTAGRGLRRLAAACGAELRVVDSELGATERLLRSRAGLRPVRLILTASGGPLLDRPTGALSEVTPAEACRHPVWTMGRKISVDSATLINKSLEVVAAHQLFDLPPAAIEVLVHPEAVVHALVEFPTEVQALLSEPEMGLTLAAALGVGTDGRLGLTELLTRQPLTFREPDASRFPGVLLGHQALQLGSAGPAVLCGADEAAVAAFLGGQLSFADIPRVVGDVLAEDFGDPGDDPESLVAVAERAERRAWELIRGP